MKQQAKSSSKKKAVPTNTTIAVNRNARFNYELGDSFEAGIELQGWEVKSIRQGKAQISDSYIIMRNNEAYIFGSVIHPLLSASTHIKPEDNRTRRLLLHRRQLNLLRAHIERKGYTIVPTKLYWSPKNKVKLEIALAKGKQLHDKRAASKESDVKRQLSRLVAGKRVT
jgi:SsrA-binding protein